MLTMPTSTRPRALSTTEPPSAKKLKTVHADEHNNNNNIKPESDLPDDSPPNTVPDASNGHLHHPKDYFADGVLDVSNVDRLKASYRSSEPFLHAVIDKLFQNDLLSKVKDECVGELSFTEKETDIYKVHQTGDLASLSYLAEQEVALLPNLLKLRDALYSQTFRDFLRKVTGCGPLSGKKQDMSVNSYKKGCHLLNHDDVIGTRSVSYILYMPMPEPESWKTEYGGSLELYPVKPGPDGVPEPECIPSKSITPSWNQFIFFEVQPGHSFHSVQEVIVDEGDCQRQRLSISGWFHRAQEGEEGYEGEPMDTTNSSLAQLTSTSTVYTPYPDIDDVLSSNPFATLKPEQLSYLSVFLDPVYLQPKVISALSKRFIDDSSIELHKFLCAPLAAKLEAGLRARDKDDGLDGDTRQGRVPRHTTGITENGPWTLQGPPHKSRYCSLSLSSRQTRMKDEEAIAALSSPTTTLEQLLSILETSLFPHPAFRTWLALIAQLLPTKYTAQARRFRPGLDYTLATSDDEQSILDVVLGLTPESSEEAKKREEKAARESMKGKKRARGSANEPEEEDEEPVGWEKGEWGGWECYMAPHEGEEDPAVYRSGSSKKKQDDSDNTHAQNGTKPSSTSTTTASRIAKHQNSRSLPVHGIVHHNQSTSSTSTGNNTSNPSTRPTNHAREKAGGDEDDDDEGEGEFDEEDEEDEDDGTLLTVQPGFNRLMLALRDEGVMRFVKYVSAAAPGSVWDVCGEYEVAMTEEEEDGVGEGEGE
ncbi:uncharacterized protein FOMMEDRAFT_147631 [Fomitiporia mediterranea MF3/22]|uniref:uncharacterized protein n=1 Tax=Fomitiporia mediterranea (strain MF3/22) TaxID=694068 RepID=UPI0004408265|nr:uncharacterized protein FOMMEDRAFT_147631 [Fomitiporia mediterranea MF3/22]EJD00945.1 hypothetical protein FOMMEDRAFT_147631 [Fomitiporia mediterranea MF3/22]